jgi:hypothetical protein
MRMARYGSTTFCLLSEIKSPNRQSVTVSTAVVSRRPVMRQAFLTPSYGRNRLGPPRQKSLPALVEWRRRAPFKPRHGVRRNSLGLSKRLASEASEPLLPRNRLKPTGGRPWYVVAMVRAWLVSSPSRRNLAGSNLRFRCYTRGPRPANVSYAR